jgi:hypothetical protein
MAIIKGDQSKFETVGSTVKIGDFKAKAPIGATVNFNDTGVNAGRTFFSGGTAYGNFKGATSTLQDGVASGSVSYEQVTDEEIFTLEVSTTTEPIDTHPDFATKIGGSKAKPIHQAIFNADGTFEKFPLKYLKSQDGDIGALNAKGKPANFGDQNRMAGVDSYLESSAVWTKSFKSDKTPTIEGLGKIMTPDGGAPTPAGRNWLYTGFSASFTSPAKGERRKKTIGTIKKEWRLSGRRGWDKDIYGNA